MKNITKFYGPTLPDSEISESIIETEENVFENESKNYKEELLTMYGTIGPLLPGCEALEEVRHKTDPNLESNNSSVKPVKNIWMSEFLPSSKIDINKCLKPRGFIMDSRGYLDNIESYQAPKRDNRESLMDLHRKRLEKDNEKNHSDLSSDEKIVKKSKKRKSKRNDSCSSDSSSKKRKKSKKHKSKRSSSADSTEKIKKKKKSKKKEKSDVKELGLGFKWSPFNTKSDRKPFNRDEEITKGGTMSESAKSQLVKQAHNMLNEFVVPSRK